MQGLGPGGGQGDRDKLREELNDLSVSNGVVVALNGCTVAAQQAAVQCGIELWGPDELAQRLGQQAVAAMNLAAVPVVAQGLPFRVSEAAGRSAAVTSGRGRMGMFGAEQVVWLAQVWLPVHVLQLGLTHQTGRLKRVAQVDRRWNTYDAVGGQFISGSADRPALGDVDIGLGALQAKSKPAAVARTVVATFERWKAVSTDAARARHALGLSQLGIAPPPLDLGVEDACSAYYPLWVAILIRGGRERVAAFSGLTGKPMDTVGRTLTANIAWLRTSMAR